jgi:uncharacterized protein YrrD
MDFTITIGEIINQHKHLIIKNINYITEKDILIEVTKNALGCLGIYITVKKIKVFIYTI